MVVVAFGLIGAGLMPLGLGLVGSLPAPLKASEKGCLERELLELRGRPVG